MTKSKGQKTKRRRQREARRNHGVVSGLQESADLCPFGPRSPHDQVQTRSVVRKFQPRQRKRRSTSVGPDNKRFKTSPGSKSRRSNTKGKKKAKEVEDARQVTASPKRSLSTVSAGDGPHGLLVYIRNVPILPKFLLPPLPPISDARLAAEAVRRHSANEQRDYNMLAMIGDAQAEVFMREYAYKLVPPIDNGLTTRINSDIARNTTWAQLSLGYNLPSTLICRNGEETAWLRKKPKVQADLFEAHIGAVWMSFGEEERDVAGTVVLRQYFKALLDQLYPMFLAAHRMKDAARQQQAAKRNEKKPEHHAAHPLNSTTTATKKGSNHFDTDAADDRDHNNKTKDMYNSEEEKASDDTDDTEDTDIEDWQSSDFSDDTHHNEDEESEDSDDDVVESLDEDDEWYEIIGTNITSLQ